MLIKKFDFVDRDVMLQFYWTTVQAYSAKNLPLPMLIPFGVSVLLTTSRLPWRILALVLSPALTFLHLLPNHLFLR